MLSVHRSVKYALIITTIIVYTTVLAFLRALTSPDEGMNLKVSRDFLIPVVFLLLGKAVRDIKVADRIVYVAAGLILAFAIFEYFALDAYLNVFGSSSITSLAARSMQIIRLSNGPTGSC